MKQYLLVFLLLLATATNQAQDYLITFTGAGAAVNVDSVRVENLTQGTSLTVGYGTQLQLLGVLSAIDHAGAYGPNTLRIYPNPANGDVFITFEATADAKTTIELFSLTGSPDVQTEVQLEKGLHTFHIRNLRNGFYTVRVESGKFHYTGKILCQSSCGNSAPGIHNSDPSRGFLKQTATIVQMQYNTGDLLKFTGHSGIFATVVMDVLADSKTIAFDFTPCTDYDNNHYAIVQAGSQIWMAENLQSSHYHDGMPAVYFDYDHDPGNSLVYGRLYDWSSAMNGAASSNTNPSNVQGVCPDGWHLPSKAEWEQFAGFLGGVNMAGGKLKETGSAHWISPNAGATDEVGFTALPAGIWAFWDEFQWKGDHCAFSTSTGNLPMVEVTTIMLQTSNGIFTVGTFHPDDAVSVRCLKN